MLGCHVLDADHFHIDLEEVDRNEINRSRKGPSASIE